MNGPFCNLPHWKVSQLRGSEHGRSIITLFRNIHHLTTISSAIGRHLLQRRQEVHWWLLLLEVVLVLQVLVGFWVVVWEEASAVGSANFKRIKVVEVEGEEVLPLVATWLTIRGTGVRTADYNTAILHQLHFHNRLCRIPLSLLYHNNNILLASRALWVNRILLTIYLQAPLTNSIAKLVWIRD